MTTQRWLGAPATVPEAIVRVLEEAGIDMAFGMPGGNTLAIYNALFDHKSTIRTILVREESLAGVMAEVYGRTTGRPGVAIGQGAFMLSNAALGTLEGYLAGSPMLLLTDLTDGSPYSHHGPYQSGTGEHGTWDARASFGGFTKSAMVLTEPVQAVQSTQQAVKLALDGQPGPVALLYHSSALRGTVGPDSKPALYPTGRYLAPASHGADPAAVAAAAVALSDAARPVLVAGNGVRAGRAFTQLVRFAEQLGIPVATTASGKGVFPESHALALGVFGTFGLDSANAVVGDADLVIAVGTKLGPTDTANEHPALLDPARQTFIQVDAEALNASWTFPVDHVLVGDAGTVLLELLDAVGTRATALAERSCGQQRVAIATHRYGAFEVTESLSDAVPLLPQRVIHELEAALPEDVIVTADAGENRIFLTHYYRTRSAGSFIQPAAIGGMGYAIPAALATKLIHPDRTVVAVCGDGGFGMAVNGLMTAREQDIPIVVVVLNNGCLGWVIHGQGGRPIASEFEDFDHGAIARAMGCDGLRVQTPGQLTSALKEVTDITRPMVIDVPTSRSETFAKVTSHLMAHPAERRP